MLRIVAASSLVKGDRETSSVAMRSRVTRIMCWRGSARPRSSSEATASDSSRVVSDTASGSYQRETLKTPVGVSARRKTRHPSRVYRPFSDSVNAPAPVAAHVSISDI